MSLNLIRLVDIVSVKTDIVDAPGLIPAFVSASAGGVLQGAPGNNNYPWAGKAPSDYCWPALFFSLYEGGSNRVNF